MLLVNKSKKEKCKITSKTNRIELCHLHEARFEEDGMPVTVPASFSEINDMHGGKHWRSAYFACGVSFE